ncbi:DUF7289 family protein [Halococcoides cellulosivorans]|nr:archaellin/type IV pilin N-terminal domain-containing protein [Halococcoides cellulosivorans]
MHSLLDAGADDSASRRESARRALSPVMGTVMIFAFVLVAVMVVAGLGTNAMELSRDEAETQQVRLSLQELADRSASVAGDPGRSAQVALSAEGRTVDPEAGTVRVDVRSSSGNSQTERTLGAVRYDRDGAIVAYQGGGVWQSETGSDSVSVVSAPPVEYRNRTAPTLTIPILRIAGDSGVGDSLTVASSGSATSLIPASMVPLPPDSSVNITVESEFYRGWGQVFEDQLPSASVSYDHTANAVTIRLLGPESAPAATNAARVDGAVVSTTGGHFSNNATVNSYNPAGVSGGPLGTVRVSDAMNSTQWTRINGPLHVDNDLRSDLHFSVAGETRVAGDANFTNNNSYRGPVSVGGNLGSDASDGAEHISLHSDLRVGGFAGYEPDGLRHLQVDGDFDVGTDADLGSETIVGGTLTAGDSVRLQHDSTTVHGDIVAGETVRVVKGHVEGDIVAGGDVIVFHSATVEGTIEADGDVIVRHRDGYTASAVTPERVVAGGDIRVEDGTSLRPADNTPGVNERMAIAGDDVIVEEDGLLQAATYASNGDGGDAVVLQGNTSKLDGHVVVPSADRVVVENTAAEYTCSDRGGPSDPTDQPTGDSGRITGCVEEQSPPSEQPTIPEPSAPATPLAPIMNDDRPAAADIVEDHRHLQDDPDSSPLISDGGKMPAWGTCDPSCTLGAGNYSMSQISVGPDTELTFDTSEGDINVFLTGSFDVLDWGGSMADAGEVHVAGDGRVSIYQTGRPATIQMGGTLTTETGSADQFWLYQKPDPSALGPGFTVGSGSSEQYPSTFTGVFYGYDSDGPGVSYRVDSHSEVNGALVGSVDGVTNHAVISYDESLTRDPPADDEDDDSGPGLAHVVYVQTEDRSVTVGAG